MEDGAFTGRVRKCGIGILHLGPIDFLSSPSYALETLAMMGAWQFGSSMVIFLAGFEAGASELYEAADVDGTKKMRQFFSITLPMISSAILFNLVMGLINAFQVFTQIAVITNGGPADSTYVYMLHLYRTAFVSHRMGVFQCSCMGADPHHSGYDRAGVPVVQAVGLLPGVGAVS